MKTLPFTCSINTVLQEVTNTGHTLTPSRVARGQEQPDADRSHCCVYSARLPRCLTPIMTFQPMPSFFHVTGAPPWFYPHTGSRTNTLPNTLTQRPVVGHRRMILHTHKLLSNT